MQHYIFDYLRCFRIIAVWHQSGTVFVFVKFDEEECVHGFVRGLCLGPDDTAVGVV